MFVAVIDAGTNTFTMNLYRILDQGGFEKLPKGRFYVNLAEKGINQIAETACNRGVDAFIAFRKQIDEYKVKAVFAFGTAALRTAKNGAALIAEIKERSGIQIDLIDGDREAELIYQGVKHAAPLTEETALILDIGGGSVEFILCNAEKRLWARSFPIGAAHLHRQFVNTDPISIQEQKKVKEHIQLMLNPLIKALKQYPAKVLIGASGTFDALEATIGVYDKEDNYAYLELQNFKQLFQRLVRLNLKEREAYPKLPQSRAELIVVAMLLVDYLIDLAAIDQDLIISDYALREGALFEFLDQMS